MGVTVMKPWPMPKLTESPGYQAPSDGLRVALHLPFARGQDAGLLAGDVDAGELAEAEGREELVDAIHAQLGGQRIEIDVAGFGDGGAQVDRAVHAAPAFARDAAGCRARE